MLDARAHRFSDPAPCAARLTCTASATEPTILAPAPRSPTAALPTHLAVRCVSRPAPRARPAAQLWPDGARETRQAC